jgi:hypothetical protein
MKKLLDSPYVGWSAILSGGVQLLGLVFLILFYALEAPQVIQSGEPSSPPVFGTLNDASFIFVALFMILPALALHRLIQLKTPTLARVTLIIGIIGLLGGAIVQLLYVPRVISSVQSSPWLTLSIGIIGVWIFLVNLLGRRGGELPGGLAWLGMITGILMSFLPVTYFIGGGSAIVSNPSARLGNPFIIIGFALGTIGFAILFPIWAIGIGRWFKRRELAIPGMMIPNLNVEP